MASNFTNLILDGTLKSADFWAQLNMEFNSPSTQLVQNTHPMATSHQPQQGTLLSLPNANHSQSTFHIENPTTSSNFNFLSTQPPWVTPSMADFAPAGRMQQIHQPSQPTNMWPLSQYPAPWVSPQPLDFSGSPFETSQSFPKQLFKRQSVTQPGVTQPRQYSQFHMLAPQNSLNNIHIQNIIQSANHFPGSSPHELLQSANRLIVMTGMEANQFTGGSATPQINTSRMGPDNIIASQGMESVQSIPNQPSAVSNGVSGTPTINLSHLIVEDNPNRTQLAPNANAQRVSRSRAADSRKRPADGTQVSSARSPKRQAITSGTGPSQSNGTYNQQGHIPSVNEKIVRLEEDQFQMCQKASGRLHLAMQKIVTTPQARIQQLGQQSIPNNYNDQPDLFAKLTQKKQQEKEVGLEEQKRNEQEQQEGEAVLQELPRQAHEQQAIMPEQARQQHEVEHKGEAEAQNIGKIEAKKQAKAEADEHKRAAEEAKARGKAEAQRLKHERKLKLREKFKNDGSALYRHYNEYLEAYPLHYVRGELRDPYLSSLLANRRIPMDETSDLARAISYAKIHWTRYMEYPRDFEMAVALQKAEEKEATN